MLHASGNLTRSTPGLRKPLQLGVVTEQDGTPRTALVTGSFPSRLQFSCFCFLKSLARYNQLVPGRARYLVTNEAHLRWDCHALI